MNYLNHFFAAGAGMVKKTPDIPDFRLGVERAENLKSVPIKANYVIANARPVMQTASEQSYEKTAYNGVNDGVTDDMFSAGYDVFSMWDAIEAGRA